MSALGPIAELRHSSRSPVALTVGACVGGAAPLTNYFTVHCGHLVWFEQGNVHFAGWSPLWILVAGSFGLSSKSVFLWGRNTFGDGWSAALLVAMLEGALLLAPAKEIGYCALVFLVLLNAAAYGSVLALRDQADKAREIALRDQTDVGKVEQTSSNAQSDRQEVRRRRRRRLTLRQSACLRRPTARHAQSLPVGIARALPTSTANLSQVRSPELDPAEVLPGPSSTADGNYARAIEVARQYPSITIEELRVALRVRQPTARALMAQLARDGVVGQTDPSNNGRRPVLLAESA